MSTWPLRTAGQVPVALILGDPELRVERSQDEIETTKGPEVHVALALGRQVHLDRTNQPEAGAAPFELRVRGVDVLDLPEQPVLAHTVRDGKTLRMVGDCDVLVAVRRGRVRHLAERGPAVAVRGVHLEITPDLAAPLRMLGEGPPDLGQGEEPRAKRDGLD